MMPHAQTGVHKIRSYNGEYMVIGRAGENIVIDWLKNNPKVVGITDFREIRAIQEADVDVGIALYSGGICLAEIKTDTHLGTPGRCGTCNILNEVLRINHHSPPECAGYLGWTLRSPAQWLLYYAPNRKPEAIYKGRFAAIRRVLQSYTKSHDVNKEGRFDRVRTNGQKTTYNILIPESEYTGIFEIVQIHHI